MAKIFKVIEDLLFPPVCVLSGCTGRRWQGMPVCLGCARKIARMHPEAVEPEEGFPVRALLQADASVLELIHGLKYRAFLRHGRFLCAFLPHRASLMEFASGHDLIVPVPLHPVRLRERGYNQAEVIGAEFSRVLGLPLRRGLRRLRHTGTQTRLGREERGKNVEGAFTAIPAAGVEGRRCLLVDDVLTTGATLRECARTLRGAGAAGVGAITLARAAPAGDRTDLQRELELAGPFVL